MLLETENDDIQTIHFFGEQMLKRNKNYKDNTTKKSIPSTFDRKTIKFTPEKIRDIILDVNNTNLDIRCEALLYAASRRQHLVEKVIPALKEGFVVICDRFVDSSLAYQGYARGIGIEEVYDINLFAINDCMPDATILLDIDPEVGLSRIMNNRQEEVNRLDLESIEFHKKVHRGYELIKEKYKDRFTFVDGNASPDEVFNQVYTTVKKIIAK